MLTISSSSIFVNKNCPIMNAIDCNGHSLLIFEKKLSNYASGPKSAPNSEWFWVRRLFNGIGFLYPKGDNFACLHIRRYQNELHLKRWFFFFAKIVIFCKSIVGPFPSVYAIIYSVSGRIKLIICQIKKELNVTNHEISWKKFFGGPDMDVCTLRWCRGLIRSVAFHL